METKILIGVASALWLAGCSSEKIVTDALSGAPQVAHQSSTIVCEYDKLTADVYVPLSLLAEAPHIVKLDNRDEATVEQWAPVAVSENYILALRREKPLPAKLFRKTGEYVAQVGALGNGPGQYHFLYDHQLDELAGRIYLCPWQTDHLLEYDLQGQFVRNIPLAKKYANVSFPKMKFVVDSERQRLTAFSLPFPNLPVMAWTQDLEGNIIDEIPIPQDMKMRPDFSHEVLTTHSAEGLNVFNTARGEYIYTYKDGQLSPVAGIDLGGKSFFHCLHLLPHHIVGSVAQMTQTSDNTWEPTGEKNFIVDRKTLRGGLGTPVNDYWGGAEVPYFAGRCYRSYYTWIYTPQEMKKLLTQVLAAPDKLDKATQKALQSTLDGIRENDNAYLVYARLRP